MDVIGRIIGVAVLLFVWIGLPLGVFAVILYLGSIIGLELIAGAILLFFGIWLWWMIAFVAGKRGG